jgi:hypothetical protein
MPPYRRIRLRRCLVTAVMVVAMIGGVWVTLGMHPSTEQYHGLGSRTLSKVLRE